MIDPHGLRALVSLRRGRTNRFLAAVRGIDDQRFVDFCQQHQLTGYCHALLQELDLPADFSTEIAWQLRAAYLRQWARSEVLLRALRELAVRFEAAGEEFILLKGFHLAQGFYGNSDRRAMNDLDLLVRRSRFERARRLLEEAGYRPLSDSPLPTRLLLGFVHHLELEKGPVPLDLHHQIRTHPSLAIAEDDLWDRRGTMEIAGHRLSVLCDEHVLLVAILTIHADVGLGTINLRPLVDLHVILERLGDGTDWPAFLARREEERTAKLCLNVLALFLIVFECEDQFPALTRVVQDRRERLVPPVERERYFRLLGSATLDLKKRWAFECYDYPLWRSAGWWLASLPVQLAAYPKTFFRDLGGRLRGRRGPAAQPDTAPARELAPMPSLASFDLEPSDLEVATCRFGSLTTRFHTGRKQYREMIEELFRIEMGEVESDTPPDANVYLFDTESARLGSHLPTPGHALIARPFDGVIEAHHLIASAFLFNGRRPIEVLLPIRRGGAEDDVVLYSVMIAVYKMLWLLGRVQLHAAAVEVGGVANVFVGDKGAGKSTISLRLGRAGGVVLGEDHIMIRRQPDDGFAVSGCDPNMRLTAKTERHFFAEELDELPRDYAGVLKKEVKAGRFVDSRPYRDVAVGRLFFSRVGERFAVEPMPRARALIRLLKAVRDRHRFAGRRDMADFLDFFADFVESAECFDLTLSPDLDDLDRLVSFLDRDLPAG